MFSATGVLPLAKMLPVRGAVLKSGHERSRSVGTRPVCCAIPPPFGSRPPIGLHACHVQLEEQALVRGHGLVQSVSVLPPEILSDQARTHPSIVASVRYPTADQPAIVLST